MWGFDESKDAYDKVDQGHHATLTHEAIAAAASFEAMKAFEDSQRRKGETVNHGLAKELLAGFAGVAVDKFVEDKGLNWIDAERAKHDAKRNANHLYDSHYGGQDQYDPNNQQPPDQIQQYM